MEILIDNEREPWRGDIGKGQAALCQHPSAQAFRNRGCQARL